jgi:SMODS and SLOG-associating 2TM effector domain
MYNICIVLQLILGAALTALGSISSKHGLAITILAAANTVNAGVVALLHNSGLRESYLSSLWDEMLTDGMYSRSHTE